MVSSSMAVSPRETIIGIRKYCWRGFACASLLLMMAVCIAALAVAATGPETRFFRIGTAATGGSFFEIGGIVARALSCPTRGPGFGACGGRRVPRVGWGGPAGPPAGAEPPPV